MKRTFLFTFLFLALLTITNLSCAQSRNNSPTGSSTEHLKPDANNAGLKLPAGFGAIEVTTALEGARHLAVTSKGDLYVKLEELKNGKGIYYLHDANGDGKTEV